MKKVALVTGSSSGIGLETALALARDGYHTFASMRDIGKAGELEYAAKKENLSIDVIELDVDKEEAIVSAIKKVVTDSGRLDVLVIMQDTDNLDAQKMYQLMILENSLKLISLAL